MNLYGRLLQANYINKISTHKSVPDMKELSIITH